MSKKFKNKYRIGSVRKQNWDYRHKGLYFITISTKNRVNYFGDVINGKMILSEIGDIALNFWNDIPEHFSFVICDEFIVMPDHIHGIINIQNPDNVANALHGSEIDALHGSEIDALHGSEIDALHATHLPTISEQMAKISPKSGSLSVIIRSYKSAVTKHARKIHSDFAWQSKFYDHIIKNENSLHNIRTYIIENPKNLKIK